MTPAEIKSLKAAMHMSCREIATAIGSIAGRSISRQAINQWEHGIYPIPGWAARAIGVLLETRASAMEDLASKYR